MRRVWILAVLLGLCAAAQGQPPIPKDFPYQLGAKPPADLANRIATSPRMAVSRAALPDRYDSRQFHEVPIIDQGSCGSCWACAGTVGMAFAAQKAGAPKGTMYSIQYTLDECEKQNGGCNGDWPETVAVNAKGRGIPFAADYPPYSASVQRCRLDSAKPLHKILRYGYVGTSDAVAPKEGIKQAIYQYGSCVVAVAVTGRWSSWQKGQVYGGSGGRDINHAVVLVGWDHDDGGEYWIMRNSWGEGWGDRSIRHGADWIGYGAMWFEYADSPLPPQDGDRYQIAGTVQVVAAGKTLAGPATATLRGKALPTGAGAYTLSEATVTPSPGLGVYTVGGTVTLKAGILEGTVTLTPGDEKAGAVVGTILLTPAPGKPPAKPPAKPKPPPSPLPRGQPVGLAPPAPERPVCGCSGACSCGCRAGEPCRCPPTTTGPPVPVAVATLPAAASWQMWPTVAPAVVWRGVAGPVAC